MHPNNSNSSLSIRLTEPVVTVRSAPVRATPRPHEDRNVEVEAGSPAVVRGLLILRLAQPTKISSIELSLQARAYTHYTKDTGTDHVDITEQHKVHSTSTFIFNAGPMNQFSEQRAPFTKPTVQLLDDHTTPGVQQGGATLHPQSPRSSRLCSGINSGDPSQDQVPPDPAPPYSDPVGQRFSSSSNSHPFIRGRLQSVASSSRTTESPCSPARRRSSPGAQSTRNRALARASSIEEVPEDDRESSHSSFLCPDDVAYYGLSRVAATSSSHSPEQDHRGRSRSRLPFAKVVDIFDAVKDRLRSRSPRSASRPPSDEQEERGRSLFKGKCKAQVSAHDIMRTLSEIEDPESLVTDDAHYQSGDFWAVFPEGTYTYPIFFTIPHDSPPTMRAEYGSLIWKVRSQVRQPGVPKCEMTAQKDVVVISVPMDEDSEEVDGIDVQRQWDDQFQYRVQIMGSSFPVGGEVPLQLTIMPLAKIKIHNIMVYLDERTGYYTHDELPARSDTIRRATLLAVKHNNSDERYSEPILPLNSDERDAFRKSPLYRLLWPGDDEGEIASSFMGPGPWTIRHRLRVPASCSMLHPSNRVKGSNVMVNHVLKIILRVEKEANTETIGKKKWDIVIHSPIQILSCRCTLAWTSLPRYEEALRLQAESAEDADPSTCPCHARNQAKVPHLASFLARSNLLGASEAFRSNSTASHTHLHVERLMSGLVSERGEVPPSYERIGVAHV